MAELGNIYGTTINGSNTLVIDFSNVDICGNLNINGGLAIDNSYGNSGQVLTSQGSNNTPIWNEVNLIPSVFHFNSNSGLTHIGSDSPYLIAGTWVVYDDISQSQYYEPNKNYNGNTENGQIRILKSGIYQINFSFTFKGNSSDFRYLLLFLLKNNSNTNRVEFRDDNNHIYQTISSSAILKIAENDSISFKCQANVWLDVYHTSGTMLRSWVSILKVG